MVEAAGVEVADASITYDETHDVELNTLQKRDQGVCYQLANGKRASATTKINRADS